MQQLLHVQTPRTPDKTVASRNLVILAKDRRIKELESENQKLQEQLKQALARAYDRI